MGLIPKERVEMNEAERMEYMKELLKGEKIPRDIVECDALEKFRAAQAQLVAVAQERAKLQQRVLMLAENEKNLSGRCDALADLLCEQEGRRRFERMKREAKPIGGGGKAFERLPVKAGEGDREREES